MLRSSWLLILAAAPIAAQVVTAEAKVSIDGRVQRVRQINGRWWSDDNRQLTKPKDGGFIWWIGSSKAPAEFFHHRPVDLPKAESLHLFMHPDDVRGLLGDPNQTLSGAGIWYYYAKDGTALFVRFIRDELAEARYERSDYGVSGRPVKSIEQELGGRSVFAVMASRATQRSAAEWHGKYNNGPAPALQSSVTVMTPDPPKTRIAKDLIDSIRVGMQRADVVRKLGDPTGGLRISGGENDAEDLTYALEPSGQATVSLKGGVVVEIRK